MSRSVDAIPLVLELTQRERRIDEQNVFQGRSAAELRAVQFNGSVPGTCDLPHVTTELRWRFSRTVDLILSSLWFINSWFRFLTVTPSDNQIHCVHCVVYRIRSVNTTIWKIQTYLLPMPHMLQHPLLMMRHLPWVQNFFYRSKHRILHHGGC